MQPNHRLGPCGLALFLGLGAALVLPAPAQQGPGLPDTTFPEKDLFKIIATIDKGGKHGHPVLHNGYLTILQSYPQGKISFYDISDPYAPKLVNSITGPGTFIPEEHDHAQTSAWGGQHAVIIHGFGPAAGGGGTGFAIWDWTDVHNPELESVFDLPGVPGGYATGVWWIAVQAPYIYCPAGTNGLFIVDASDPTKPFVANHLPTSQTGGFNTVLAYAVGNTLIVTNNDLATGISRFDIGDPIQPQLLETKRAMPAPYGARLNAGLLLTPSVDGSFYIHDALQPGFPQIGKLTLGYRMSSAIVQDGFVHLGGSNSPAAYYKVDIRDPANPAVVGRTSTNHSPSDEDWLTPMGNLAIVGDDEGGGTEIIPQQRFPDRTGPVVNMVSPVDGAESQPVTSRVGVTMTDMIELASIDTGSFIVRPLGGSAVAGRYTHQFGVVNFVPSAPLRPNTTYEVVIPQDGMRDWAGNGVRQTFVSRFTTGALEALRVTVQPSAPVLPGTAVSFDVKAVSGPGSFEYSWDFGDGTPPTPFSPQSGASHAYTKAGHYAVICTVTNGELEGTGSYVQAVHYPLTPNKPAHSSTIVMRADGSRVFCVNPDNDTVSGFDPTGLVKLASKNIGDHPRTLAIAPDNTIWIVCQDDASIHIVQDVPGQHLGQIDLPPGSEPYGIVMSPDGSAAYVSLMATGQVVKLDPWHRAIVDVTDVGPDPKGLAVSADSRRIFVTRFRSSARPVLVRDSDTGPAPVAEIYELDAASFTLAQRRTLAMDPGPDTEVSGRGLPNYLNSLTISPDGRRLWVPSKKDNIQRGAYRDDQPLTFQNTVRTIVSQIDLATGRELLGERVDFNDSEGAFAVAFSRAGDYAFQVLQGSHKVDVLDAYSGELVAAFDSGGLAPQGVVLSPDDSRLFVHNFMSRTVAVFDIASATASTSFSPPLLATISSVNQDKLPPQVLLGKQIFYNAADARMNKDGYISCASCHLDGDDDGRVWDFTDRGEGLRNTISLLGKSGTGHGRLHWTANFDEIQDFENDIRNAFRGEGFMSTALYNSGTVSLPLGQPKAGLSPELDALSAYVSSLSRFGRSPDRLPSGSLTAAGERGKVVFERLRCAVCHSGPNFADGQIHDVGTINPGAGKASGGPLLGFDTPTLRGLWRTAPYLHDGSAATLLDVITAGNARGRHGATLSLGSEEREDLVAYLRQIDDLEPAPR